MILVEARLDQGHQSVQSGPRLAACGGDEDFRTRRRRQHHEAHDRGPGDLGALPLDGDRSLEALRALDELGRSARMQAALVADGDPLGQRLFGAGRGGERRVRQVRSPARTWLATLI